MKYYNISQPSERVTLAEAVLHSTRSATGLYMPEHIPAMEPSFFRPRGNRTLQETAYEVSVKMLGDDIPLDKLKQIVDDSLSFDIPLRQLGENLFVLELFHGPTLAFKDVGARFMAALLEYLVRNENREITILAATSGDTGSAVANAFFRKKGINVLILYPSGKVSEIQEKQLTTMGGNITALEIDGDFDDCQRLVKLAFADSELSEKLTLTSGNSINFGRLFPQSFYYFHACGQLPGEHGDVVISVPSGNFGNLTAGMIAARMGLPVREFVAATNSNHPVADYLTTGIFKPRDTKHTITNAMDVGNPSNFPRILNMFGNEHSLISASLKSFWFTDDDTRQAMKELQNRYSYIADPHGAVGYLGLKKYSEKENYTGIFLETAHPSKFIDEVEAATGTKVIIPDRLLHLLSLEKRSVKLSPDYSDLRQFLLDNQNRLWSG